MYQCAAAAATATECVRLVPGALPACNAILSVANVTALQLELICQLKTYDTFFFSHSHLNSVVTRSLFVDTH